MSFDYQPTLKGELAWVRGGTRAVTRATSTGSALANRAPGGESAPPREELAVEQRADPTPWSVLPRRLG